MRLRATYPDVKVVLKQNTLTWDAWVTPGPQSRRYRIRITWDGRRSPKVRVLEPKLEPPPGKQMKHVFNADTLCLHLPGEWDGSMLIEDTIIPWTHEWLLFYELYLATGEWLGGGHEFEDGVHVEKGKGLAEPLVDDDGGQHGSPYVGSSGATRR